MLYPNEYPSKRVHYVGKWGCAALRVGLMSVESFSFESSDWSMVCKAVGNVSSIGGGLKN